MIRRTERFVKPLQLRVVVQFQTAPLPSFDIVPSLVFTTQMFAPSNAPYSGPDPTLNVPRLFPLAADNLVTVLLPKFTTHSW